METTNKTQEPTSNHPVCSKSKHAAVCVFCGDRRNNCNRRFHRFPYDPYISQKWAVATGKKWIISASFHARNQRYHVCSNHFSDKDYATCKKAKLRPHAVPEPSPELKEIVESKQKWITIKHKLRKALRSGKSDVRTWKYDEQTQVLMSSPEKDSEQSTSFAGNGNERKKQNEQGDYQLIAEVFTEYDVNLPTDSATPNVSKLSPMKTVNAIPEVRQSIQCSSSSTTNSINIPKLSLPKAIKPLKPPYQCNKNKYNTNCTADSPISNPPKLVLPTTNTLPGKRQPIGHNSSTAKPSYVLILSLPAKKTLKEPCQSSKCSTSTSAVPLPSDSSKVSEEMNTLPGKCQPTEDTSSVVHSPGPSSLPLPENVKTLRKPHQCNTSPTDDSATSNSPHVLKLFHAATINTKPRKWQTAKYDSSVDCANVPRLSLTELNDNHGTLGKPAVKSGVKTLREPYQCSEHGTSFTSDSVTSDVLKLSRTEETNMIPLEHQSMECDNSCSSDSSGGVSSLPSPKLIINVEESAMESEAEKTLPEPPQRNQSDTSSAADSTVSYFPSTSLEVKKRKLEHEASVHTKYTAQPNEKELDSIDLFFLKVASSVKKFSPNDQYIVKSQIDNLVNKIGEKYVTSQTNE